MSLIDKATDDKIKSNEVQKDFLKCNKCQKEILKNSIILLCEDCFNYQIKESLNHIINNLIKINDSLNKIKEDLKKIDKEISLQSNIVILNNLEIQKMNIEAIEKKLIIDRELNEKAFIITQEQANKIREKQNWTKFDILKNPKEFQN